MDGARDDETVSRAVAEARAAFVAALGAGDAHAAADVYADDARLLAPSAEPIRGRGAIAAFWQAGVDAGVAEVELDAFELRRHDGFAYELGRYALRLRPHEGRGVVDRGKYVLVHERQADGAWRWALEMFSPDEATREPSARAHPHSEEGTA